MYFEFRLIVSSSNTHSKGKPYFHCCSSVLRKNTESNASTFFDSSDIAAVGGLGCRINLKLFNGMFE
jgi:hypothetical protein